MNPVRLSEFLEAFDKEASIISARMRNPSKSPAEIVEMTAALINIAHIHRELALERSAELSARNQQNTNPLNEL